MFALKGWLDSIVWCTSPPKGLEEDPITALHTLIVLQRPKERMKLDFALFHWMHILLDCIFGFLHSMSLVSIHSLFPLTYWSHFNSTLIITEHLITYLQSSHVMSGMQSARLCSWSLFCDNDQMTVHYPSHIVFHMTKELFRRFLLYICTPSSWVSWENKHLWFSYKHPS